MRTSGDVAFQERLKESNIFGIKNNEDVETTAFYVKQRQAEEKQYLNKLLRVYSKDTWGMTTYSGTLFLDFFFFFLDMLYKQWVEMA